MIHRRAVLALAVPACVAVAVAGAAVSAGAGDGALVWSAARSPVTVPRVVGERLDRAYARLRRAGLRVTIAEPFVDGSLRRLLPRVAQQTPRAGTRLPAGRAVRLDVPATWSVFGVNITGVGSPPRMPSFRGRTLAFAFQWARAHDVFATCAEMATLRAGAAPMLEGNFRVTGQSQRPGHRGITLALEVRARGLQPA